MPRSRAATHNLPRQATELALAVPQVIGHRLGRMAAAGPMPSARDQREFHRMGTEKVEAFSQSGWLMATGWVRLQQQWFQQVVALASLPWTAWQGGQGAARATALWQAWPGQTAHLVSRGLTPIHQTAVANARRLGGAGGRRRR